MLSSSLKGLACARQGPVVAMLLREQIYESVCSPTTPDMCFVIREGLERSQEEADGLRRQLAEKDLSAAKQGLDDSQQASRAMDALQTQQVANPNLDLQASNDKLTSALEVAHRKQKEAEARAEGLEASKRELTREKAVLVARQEVDAREVRERRMRYVVNRMMGKSLDWAFDRSYTRK
jgi:hypothetical protein